MPALIPVMHPAFRNSVVRSPFAAAMPRAGLAVASPHRIMILLWGYAYDAEP